MMRTSLQLVDYPSVGRPCSDDMAVRTAPLSIVLTQELDGASATIGVSVDDLLIAALGRTIARTIGEGAVDVDVPGHGRTLNPISLVCVGPTESHANEMLAHVHRTVTASILQRVVHGLAEAPPMPASDILLTCGVDDPARLGHSLELHAHRSGDVLALDWWYDTRSFEPYTVQELSEQFPYSLIELTSEATDLVNATEMAMAH